MIRDTYQLMDQLSKEMENYRRWHPHFISELNWKMSLIEIAANHLSSDIGANLIPSFNGLNLIVQNFSKAMSEAKVND